MSQANKFVATVLLLAQVSWVTPAFAVDPVTSSPQVTTPIIVPLRPGDRVPWSGLLLNPPAVAQIKVDLDTAKEQCALTTRKEVATAKADCDFRSESERATAERQKAEVEAALKSRTSEVVDLQKRLEKIEKDKTNVYLYTGLGAVGGIVLTVITVFAVSRASK